MGEGKNIRMKFICNQDWDEMHPTANGRYCDVCRQEVLDFTTKSVNEIEKGKQDLCGRFLIEQVDASIIKPIQAPKQMKSFGLISALLFSVFTKSTFGQTTAVTTKTEQVENKGSLSNADTSTTVCDTIEEDETPRKTAVNNSPFLRTNKRNYYWSRKFPFITIKKRRLMGKFRASH